MTKKLSLKVKFMNVVAGLLRASFGASVVLLSLLVIGSCSGNDVTQSPTTTPTANTSATAPATTDVSSSASPGTNSENALRAALSILSVENTARCPTPNTGAGCNTVSVDAQPGSSDFDHGLAYFKTTGSAGDHAVLVLGQTRLGAWDIYISGPLQFYNAVQLPKAITICGFGSGAAVHSSPAAESSVAETLTDGTSANADQFVLTQPGRLPSAQPGGFQGYGWYHLPNPSGWVYSRYVAGDSSCALHDSIETH
jgi:hypothetical protein